MRVLIPQIVLLRVLLRRRPAWHMLAFGKELTQVKSLCKIAAFLLHNIVGILHRFNGHLLYFSDNGQ